METGRSVCGVTISCSTPVVCFRLRPSSLPFLCFQIPVPLGQRGTAFPSPRHLIPGRKPGLGENLERGRCFLFIRFLCWFHPPQSPFGCGGVRERRFTELGSHPGRTFLDRHLAPFTRTERKVGQEISWWGQEKFKLKFVKKNKTYPGEWC